MTVPSQIATELDEMHAHAKAAFEQRDLSGYRELFAPGLTYRQSDGRVIDRDRLMSDVEAQFHRLSWVRSSFVREEIETEGLLAVLRHRLDDAEVEGSAPNEGLDRLKEVLAEGAIPGADARADEGRPLPRQRAGLIVGYGRVDG